MDPSRADFAGTPGQSSSRSSSRWSEGRGCVARSFVSVLAVRRCHTTGRATPIRSTRNPPSSSTRTGSTNPDSDGTPPSRETDVSKGVNAHPENTARLPPNTSAPGRDRRTFCAADPTRIGCPPRGRRWDVRCIKGSRGRLHWLDGDGVSLGGLLPPSYQRPCCSAGASRRRRRR